MARRYKRDAKGRFASANASGKAPARIQAKIVYHGTSPDSAKAIRAGGYKPTGKAGLNGPGVYTTARKGEAARYSRQANKGDRGVVLKHRVIVGPANIYRQHRMDLNSKVQEAVKAGKVAYTTGMASSNVLMNKKVANRTLVPANGVITPRRRRR